MLPQKRKVNPIKLVIHCVYLFGVKISIKLSIPSPSSPPFGDNVAPAPCQLPPQRAIPGRQGYTTGGSSCFVVAVVVKRLKIWVKQRALDWTWVQSGCCEGTNKTYKDLCRITWMSWENSTVEKSVESLDLGGTIWYHDGFPHAISSPQKW